MSEHPPVSIVIPTRNERRHIVDCLMSLEAQDYPAVKEILVVDGRSDDGTRTIVEEWGGVVRLVDNPGLTAAAAMNRGLAQASADLIVRGVRKR